MNLPGQLAPLILLALTLTTACSSVQTNLQAASGSLSGSELATVYLYRNHESPGGAVSVDIKDNGLDVGTLRDGTYFVYHANPGEHLFIATADTTSTQNLKLQPGATYYVEARLVRNQDIFQPSLTVVFDLQGEAAIQNLKRLQYRE
jgi:hypothetical protein